LKVAIIGLWIASVTSSILLPVKVPEIQLTIIGKNSDMARFNFCSTFWHLYSRYVTFISH